MKFYILDDDRNTCLRIAQIIEEQDLGSVINFSQDAVRTLDEFEEFNADVMIIDLLMPGIDGINFVKKARQMNDRIEFIMISQVNRKEMVAKAYEAGVRFFIQKPINRIEVTEVVRSLAELVDYRKKFDTLQEVFQGVAHPDEKQKSGPDEGFKKVLIEIGIWGEKGTREIIRLAEYIDQNGMDLSEVPLRELFREISDSPQNFEQRIRRAVNRGLTNLAYIGLEDNLNNTFVMYSNTLYDFESVKKEMEHLRGHSDRGGKVNLKKFIETLMNI